MKKIEEKVLFNGKWLSLKESTYENARGEKILWESIDRTNNSTSCVIIAKLKPSNRFILIKQFRPAIDGFVIGFPAGLDNDSDEKIIEELREETGYTGAIVSKSPNMKSGSGVLNDTGKVITMYVDEALECNISPKQELEPTEVIDVILIDQSEIKSFLIKSIDEGVAIGANLWYLFVVSQEILNN